MKAGALASRFLSLCFDVGVDSGRAESPLDSSALESKMRESEILDSKNRDSKILESEVLAPKPRIEFDADKFIDSLGKLDALELDSASLATSAKPTKNPQNKYMPNNSPKNQKNAPRAQDFSKNAQNPKDLQQILSQVLLIVGLGNPGRQYAVNRHNIGFMIIDRLCEILRLEMKPAKSFDSDIASIASKQIHILKPQTFMNNSGVAVAKVARFYKISQILVLHDDMDISFGAIKYKNGGGSGGHNGLKSIDNMLGSNDYVRLRFGIGKGAESSANTRGAAGGAAGGAGSVASVGSAAGAESSKVNSSKAANHDKAKSVISFVLGDFDKAQSESLPSLIDHSVRSILFFMQTRDFQSLQNFFTLAPAKNNVKKSSTQNTQEAENLNAQNLNLPNQNPDSQTVQNMQNPRTPQNKSAQEAQISQGAQNLQNLDSSALQKVDSTNLQNQNLSAQTPAPAPTQTAQTTPTTHAPREHSHEA
ncbi:hypothetical protein BKN38_07890 [Helicobacter sp. CLO-3]|uniref:aminoacyl-tRNA hydrolase n=1 Tax=unclassified Helicobacter TaxID=2593540 RepID=UPI0008047EAB|nr:MULTISPECIES: aminoacyl-tRNA hydrolase [unclassified Helicobacter]OBV29078.1 hypothetical protein BA723_06970 [Helicobacter sp. CLO-3]OHU81954.1 hypothetical protein BKN38_07890 [Helicobacter sp. CLO-3]